MPFASLNGRTLPNAEHSCAGHFASIFFDARAFYYTVLLVSHLAPVLMQSALLFEFLSFLYCP